ncbi:MAG: hydroxymethylbilane synthase [Chloroflexota bacterium]
MLTDERVSRASPTPPTTQWVPGNPLRLALRGSRLSRAQATTVVDLLRRRWPGLSVPFQIVATHGDRDRATPLVELAATDGVFTRAVEDELLAGHAEWAVHSLKDLPSALNPALTLAAIPRRGAAHDVFVSRYGAISGLPAGALVGTSSPRRAAQLLAVRPDARVVPVRGNVETRVRKLDAGHVDALVLAAAGLERLGVLDARATRLPIEQFVPAVGQGALGAQCRRDDAAIRELLATIDDAESRAAVTAERAFLRALNGGCRTPIAAHGRVGPNGIYLQAFVATPDASHVWRGVETGPLTNPTGTALELVARFRTECRGGPLLQSLVD